MTMTAPTLATLRSPPPTRSTTSSTGRSGGPTAAWWLLTNHMVMMLLAAGLMLLIFPAITRRYRDGEHVPTGTRNFFEAILVYLRNDVVKPILGDKTDRYIPYLWTLFFFILFCNLLGLLPIDLLTGKLLRPGPPRPRHLRHRHQQLLGHRDAGADLVRRHPVQRHPGQRLRRVVEALPRRCAGVPGAGHDPGRVPRHARQAVLAGRASRGQHDRRAHPAGGASSASSRWRPRRWARSAAVARRHRRRSLAAVGDHVPRAVRRVPAGVPVHVPDDAVHRPDDHAPRRARARPRRRTTHEKAHGMVDADGIAASGPVGEVRPVH